MKKLAASFFRGGTSKGLFFVEQNLPVDQELRNSIFLRIIGSPDKYKTHIDGIGGATSSTSKIMIVEKPDSTAKYDIAYTFGHVSIDKPIIDYSGNCGNLSAAVPLFALYENLVDFKKKDLKQFKFRMLQKNVNQIIEAEIDLNLNDYYIDGVAFPGQKVSLNFISPGGSKTGKLLPTSNLIDKVQIGEQKYQASMIDSGIPTVFLNIEQFGITGLEQRNQLNQNHKLLETLEKIRIQSSLMMGITKTAEEASKVMAIPKLCLVKPATDYYDSSNRLITKNQVNIICRYLSMGQFHHAIPATGTICASSAIQIKGSICNQVATSVSDSSDIVIGHGSGIIQCNAKIKDGNVDYASLIRTARLIMKGDVYY